MPEGKGISIGWRHLAVAIAYALAYGLLREVTFTNWVPLAGFRFCVLLFVPYRYWPALLVGEFLPLAYVGITCAPKYGWLWSATFMVPPMLFAMPVIRWCREGRRLFPARTATDINMFLLCTLVVSSIWAAVNTGTFSLMRGPLVDAYPYETHTVAGWYLIGNYIGVLTLAPLALLAREELLAGRKRPLWVRCSESRLLLDAVRVLLPALALLAWLASGSADHRSQEARIAMFLPVAWLALRHGWRGAAVGGSAASVAVILTMPSVHDTDTLNAQVFVAFAVSTMMMLGGRIASLHARELRQRTDARLAFAMAQRNAHLGEMQLQQISCAIEQMSGSIQASYTQLLGRLRSVLPGTDERNCYRQAALTQHQMYRLADSLYPLALRERGLLAALREGSMPRALDEAGLVYWCGIGDGLEKLSFGTHLALYRLTCEAVAIICARRNASRIDIRLRAGTFGGRRWAVLQVESHVDYERLGRVRWDDLEPILGGSGLGLEALRDRAAIFEGKVRTRSLAQCNRISVMLFDPDMP